MKDIYFRKEYKHRIKLSTLILMLIAIALSGTFMFYMVLKNDTLLSIDGIEFNVAISTGIFALLGGGYLILCIMGVYSGWLGFKIKRNVVLDSHEITFFKSNFTSEQITKRYTEIRSVSEINHQGQIMIRVMYNDGTKREFARILFTSKEEYLDFQSNLGRLIEETRSRSQTG